MKKTIETAVALMSAVMMLGTCAVPAFAGELSKEELIQKYAPNGPYAEDEIYTAPNGFPTVMADGSLALQHDYVQKLAASGLSVEEQLEKLNETFSNSTGSKVSAYNSYRRGSYADCVQYFVNAEYENGFWYVLREDGTASIVGADQVWVEENSPTALHIPAEIGGVTVTKIEDGAFAFETRYNHDIQEITIPDTVEIIGDSAFDNAMLGPECKINLPQNVKYIGRLAFYATSHMLMNEFDVITLPESLEFIGKRAFDGSLHSGKDAYQSHLRFFSENPANNSKPGGMLLDMPESPVFCEVNELYTVENPLGDVTYWDRINGIDTVFSNPRDDNDDISIMDLIYDTDRAYRVLKACYGGSVFDEMFDEQVAKYRKAAEFAEAYDTTKMPVNHIAVMSLTSVSSTRAFFLYDQYNIVDLKDVTEYYNKLAEKLAPFPAVHLAGDVDCSGKVDVSDAVLLARFVAEDASAKITDAGLQNADADGDGAVTTDDITAIQRIIAKL